MSFASQPLDDGSQPLLVDIDTFYFEAIGGEKKRRVYGLGSRAASIYPSSCQSTGAHTHQHLQLELERLCSRSLEIRKRRWIEQLLS